MTTYREIFANREFRALFAGNAATVAGKTIQMLALSALVYASTGSPLLSALAFLGGLLPQALGAMTLLAYADRVRPRGFLAGWDVARAIAALVLASGVLPVWGMLLLIMAFGAVDALSGGVRNAILVDVLPGGFVLGRATLNVSVGAMQILGFATGGTLIATLGPHRALAVAAVFIAFSAVITFLGLRTRPPRATGRAGVSATWQGNRTLFANRSTRAVLLAAWVPNGLIVGAEAMYVPYAGDWAAVLFVAAAAGMLTGDLVIGRFVPPATLNRFITKLQALLAVPYLLFFLHPDLTVGAVAVFVASFGYAGTLGLQQRLIDHTPEDLRGQALGLDGSGRMTFQAIGAGTVGLVAEATGPATAMTVAAIASLTVTALLQPRLRAREDPRVAQPAGTSGSA
ncbi:MFS transporter [Asanoa siamensis]|uniref:Membrane protein n=1 Tax=Asanoa siamensis TaxID=926357 RepID=A0ABQ4CJ76_9ACTN|nr:MFS transporter [Asanoa siamensis]GIF71356.1 membrane protein [Asanoa siamensis]